MKLTKQQETMVSFLKDKHFGALFVGVGLGKTRAMLEVMMSIPENQRSFIIVAPASITTTVWQYEIEKWDIPLLINKRAIDKSNAQIMFNNWYLRKLNILIISYDSLHLLEEHLDKQKKYNLILDESHFVKEHNTKRFKTLKRIYKKNAPKRAYLMTGTPIVNGYENLFTQLFLLDGGKRLGSTYTGFLNEFTTSTLINNQFMKISTSDEQKKKIINTIADICLVIKSDEKSVQMIPQGIFMDEKSKSLYQNVEQFIIPALTSGKQVYKHKRQMPVNMHKVFDDLYDELDYIIENKLEQAQKLRQVASGFVYLKDGTVRYVNKSKVKLLDDILQTKSGKGLIIFYQYIAEKDTITAWCKKNKLFLADTLDTDTLKLWDEHKIDVLLLHPKNASYGFNLQHGGSTVVWYTLPYSIVDFKQGNARVNRMGQKDEVQIYTFTTYNTIDEAVSLILHNKEQELQLFLTRMTKKYKKDRGYELWINELKNQLTPD